MIAGMVAVLILLLSGCYYHTGVPSERIQRFAEVNNLELEDIYMRYDSNPNVGVFKGTEGYYGKYLEDPYGPYNAYISAHHSEAFKVVPPPSEHRDITATVPSNVR
jgi:sorbitol-specific phosphotransferase system component IIC